MNIYLILKNVKKNLIFGVDFWENKSRMPQPDFTPGRETERKEEKDENYRYCTWPRRPYRCW